MHWKNLVYVLKHKWYVFLECCRLGIFWRGIIHDWSKFLPSEWFPYARHFFRKGLKERRRYHRSGEDKEFDLAWLKHLHRNKHHWQFWVLVQNDDPTKVLPMPDKYRKEMLADWIGAGKAQGFGNNTKEWYMEHKHKMVLHSDTRNWIEKRT